MVDVRIVLLNFVEYHYCTHDYYYYYSRITAPIKVIRLRIMFIAVPASCCSFLPDNTAS